MFRSNFDKNLENATSHLRLEPDWPSILLICDEINQKDVTPKSSFAAIKKKMTSPNPHSACYALMVLESVVKNCGAPIHDEVFTKENCEMFSTFLEQTPHENVRQKMLELIQTWAYAFRSSEKYQAIKDTMTILKTKGHSFPELKETDAMFTADTAPNWADGKVCHRCRAEFTFTNRKHHCRNCGQVFCGQCTAKQCPLPKYGIEKEVRVCDGCFTSLQKSTIIKSTSRTSDNDLPAEYLNSSLAQQEQTPLRKSDQEWKELEELHLALALSKSEAEEKNKHKVLQPLNTSASVRSQQSSPVLETPAQREYAQQEENTDLAKYLNRTYWEQRKVADSLMDSPSAPSPMPTPQLQSVALHQKPADEIQIDEFAGNMRTQVEIFVNRMKSNSSRGRSIANDSSVQTLFLTLTSLHSQQLSFIKEMDDKRMWFEQLQDKLVQIKDSRAALDVLRQEYVEKLRRIAEEQERQRQIQMAQKLEIMRKKKQEYLQYQRQLALQRIQEQEREMQMRQEQQKAQYRMGQTSYPFMPPNAVGAATHNSPSHHMSNVFNPYTYNANPPPVPMAGIQYNTQNQPVTMGGAPAPIALAPLPGMYTSGIIAPLPNHNQHSNMLVHGPINTGMLPPNSSLMSGANMQQQHAATPPLRESMLPGSQAISQQQQQQQQQQPTTMAANVPDQQQTTTHVIMQHPNREQVPSTAIAGAVPLSAPVATNPPQMASAQAQASSALANTQIEAVAAAPIPPQADPEPPAIARSAVEDEPATAELISFD